MALAIKETPILTGKNAREFEEKIKENESKKISEEDYKQALNNFKKVKISFLEVRKHEMHCACCHTFPVSMGPINDCCAACICSYRSWPL